MHFVFYNVFLSFENYDHMTNFSQKMDQAKKHFLDYTMNYPKIISSTKWKYDYVVFRKKNINQNQNEDLDSMMNF